MVAGGSALHRDLLAWYARARRDLPWRRVRDPYAIWVSETMLQQTRVQTAIPYYERFMRELPTVHALAEATEQHVLTLWAGLGYYRRARLLHAAAKEVTSSHGGRLPATAEELRGLSGVGRYTAGAIASIAFGRRASLVDGNVARVLARLYAIEEDVKSTPVVARLWSLADELVADAPEPGDWNQALMELGATVCTPRDPQCATCPVAAHCFAFRRGIAADLPRSERRPRAIPVRRNAVVLASRSHVLLARRRPDSLYGGLWEPPSTEGDLAALAAALGVRAHALRPVGEVAHLLTHRRMTIAVAAGELPRRSRGSKGWAPWALPGPEYDAIEPVALEPGALGAGDGLAGRPLSSLARKLLIVANVPSRGLRWKK